MNGAVPLFLLFAFMVWTGKVLPFTFFERKNSSQIYRSKGSWI